MKILYDYQGLVQKHSGGSKMYFELMKHLPDDVQYSVGLKECNNEHLKRLKVVDVPPSTCEYEDFLPYFKIPYKHKLYRFLSKFYPSSTSEGRNREYSIKLLKEGNYDIFHPTFLDDYFLPYLNGKPFVLHIHDMTTEIMPYYFGGKNNFQTIRKKRLVGKAAHIVCVSRNTKKDVMNILGVPESKITVIYHGFPDDNILSQQKIIDTPYFLYVGGRQLYKNFIPMVKSLIPVLERHPEYKIVCAGGKFSSNEQDMLNSMYISDKVIQLSVNDDDLMNLYSNAKCFIYPSLYEGFGIPILEAYKAKCPVLLNNKSCFPEIAGDAAMYFHLDKEEDNLGEEIERFLQMPPKDINVMVQKQCERMELFTWHEAANRLAEVYRHILAQ